MPVLFCYVLTCPDQSRLCLYYQMYRSMQKRPGLGCPSLFGPLSPSISVQNTSLCRIWSKTVQNSNPIPVQIRFKMPGPFCMGGPFCTVGSCRTVRVWVFVYNLDCAFQNSVLNMNFHRIWSKPVQNINDSPVLFRFNMPGPFCTAHIGQMYSTCRTVRV